MTWLAPAAAWWLLLIPALVLLYILRPQPLRRPVSSLRLWREVPQVDRSRARLRRPPLSLLLLLQVLLLAAGAFALMRPALSEGGSRHRELHRRGRLREALAEGVGRERRAPVGVPPRHVLLGEHAARDGDELVLTLRNRSGQALRAHVEDAYSQDRTVRVRRGGRKKVRVGLRATHGWYDVLVTVKHHPKFKRALAGRIDSGGASISDPQLGR
jgi:hypothetical protein